MLKGNAWDIRIGEAEGLVFMGKRLTSQVDPFKYFVFPGRAAGTAKREGILMRAACVWQGIPCKRIKGPFAFGKHAR